MRGGLLSEARVASEGFEALTSHLANHVSELQALCMLSHSGSSGKDAMTRVVRSVDVVEERLVELEAHVEEELSHVREAKALMLSLAAQNAQAEFLLEQLAPHVTEEERNQFQQGLREDAESAVSARGPEDADGNGASECGDGDSDGGAGGESGNRAAAGVCVGEDGALFIEAPTDAQLDKVPQYMKGRMTLEKLKVAVDVINATMLHKQTTLAIPRGKQSVAVRDQVLQWRDQEMDEARGLFFVTREDVFTQASKSRVDVASLKTALQVVRYLGWLRLVSGGGVYRFCVVN